MAQSSKVRVSLTEIEKVEAKVKMPHGAGGLRKYIRYYYLSNRSEGRNISGVYIDKNLFDSSKVPAARVVIVDGEADIPDVEDGGCSVVYVEYDRRRAAITSASCSADLISK